MSTSYTITPTYGAEVFINEENNIVITQGEEDTVILTPAEAQLLVEYIQKLLLELGK